MTINTSHAFLYTGTPGAGGMMVDLGTLGGDYSSGNGINDTGQVAGCSYTAGNAARHAFLYTGTPGAGGTMADLGTLGGLESIAFAVNASGQVTGNTEIGGLASHAFLYTGTPGAGGTMADLGSLGGSYSTGNAVNARGQVAGMSYMADDYTRHAFLYTGTPGTDGHMIDLDAWLDVVNPIEGAKWTLFEAEGLTDTGLITGYGFYTGGESSTMCAFLLDASSLVPEPTTLSLLALGGLAMLRRKRR